jgi:hypothetical protein
MPGGCVRGPVEPPLGLPLQRRAAMAGAVALSMGCTFSRAAFGDEPVLVDGWLVRPSDIKLTAQR